MWRLESEAIKKNDMRVSTQQAESIKVIIKGGMRLSAVVWLKG